MTTTAEDPGTATRPTAAGGGREGRPILSVRDLVVSYRVGTRRIDAVRDVSFDLFPNQAMALVGESGCGKTTLGLGLLRLLPRLGSIPSGSITYCREGGHEIDVLALQRRQLRQWRWAEAAMVFQGAMNAFNPVLSVQEQMFDTLLAHTDQEKRKNKAAMRDHAGDTLRMVRLEPRQVLGSYPHELSGGMRQRVLIAMSLLLDPRLLVFDEPTTALDILTQRAIIDVLAELREEKQFAMIFISHDLSLAAELADRVVTMYAGKIIETGSVNDIFYHPRHPYTSGLINAVPPVVGDLPKLASIPGSPPSLASLPQGCSFAPRCSYVIDECRKGEPPLDTIAAREHGLTHAAACLRWSDVHHERQVVASA